MAGEVSAIRWELDPGPPTNLRNDTSLAALFEQNDQLAAALEDAVRNVTVDIREGFDHCDRALAALLPKACKTHQALLRLAESGYGEDAYALARTLFELAVYARAIAADETGELAQRWVDWSHVEAFELYQMARTGRFPSLGKLVEALDAHPEAVAELERKALEVQGRWTFWKKKGKVCVRVVQHWSGIERGALRKLAERPGVDLGEQYALTQTLASQHVHGSSATIVSYTRDDGTGMTFGAQPSAENVGLALADAHAYLQIIVDAWAQVLAVPDDVRQRLGITPCKPTESAS